MSDGEQKSKILIDDDWKSQAQAEREKLAEAEAKAEAAKGEGGKGELPPADFRGLLGTLASQAIMYLGGMVDPKTGGAMVDLEVSRMYIDLLAVLEEKTKGNLSEEEQEELTGVLQELRARYVEISKLLAAQLAKQREQGGGGAGGVGGIDLGGGGGGSPIIT